VSSGPALATRRAVTAWIAVAGIEATSAIISSEPICP
jgi:hypothetical protein